MLWLLYWTPDSRQQGPTWPQFYFRFRRSRTGIGAVDGDSISQLVAVVSWSVGVCLWVRRVGAVNGSWRGGRVGAVSPAGSLRLFLRRCHVMTSSAPPVTHIAAAASCHWNTKRSSSSTHQSIDRSIDQSINQSIIYNSP